MICRVCNSKMKFEQSICECFVRGFDLREKMTENYSKTVDVYRCPNCTHRQIDYCLDEHFYEDIETSGGAIQYKGSLCKTEGRIGKLKDLAYSTNKLIEIGCGPGYGLLDAQKFFKQVLGIDPNKNEIQVAQENGLDVICGYFNKNLNLTEKYSAFTSFQVFEHLENLYEVLDYAYEILEDNGVGLINVPNGQYIFDNGLYHQVVLEHINYYSPFSLSYCCNKAGFEVLEVCSCKETMELNIYLRKKVNNIKMEDIRTNQKNALKEIISKFNNIAIYGAGAKANKYITLFESDDKKKIKFLFASAYNNEIIDSLMNKYHFNGKIVYFDDDEVKCL